MRKAPLRPSMYKKPNRDRVRPDAENQGENQACNEINSDVHDAMINPNIFLPPPPLNKAPPSTAATPPPSPARPCRRSDQHGSHGAAKNLWETTMLVAIRK